MGGFPDSQASGATRRGRWGDGEMVSHCVGRVPRLVASGATRRGRWGDEEMGRW
ncbi:MAG: hypothetical protein AAF915_25755 [Cyanobacteria bacterium P01_D01_bin.50]